jgi:hypothetical protein
VPCHVSSRLINENGGSIRQSSFCLSNLHLIVRDRVLEESKYIGDVSLLVYDEDQPPQSSIAFNRYPTRFVCVCFYRECKFCPIEYQRLRVLNLDRYKINFIILRFF